MSKENEIFLIAVASSKSVGEQVKKLATAHKGASVQNLSPSSLSSDAFAGAMYQLLVCESKEHGEDDLLASLVELRRRFPRLPVAVVTSAPHHGEAVKFLRAGVQEYLSFPEEQTKLFEFIESSIRDWRSVNARKSFVKEKSKNYDFQNIIGSSPKLQQVLTRSRKLLGNPNITVLIGGETGTGKELLAKAIHYGSSNSTEPFVEISCSSIPDSLLESELFGYEKGAFTDAKNQKKGLLEIAGKGTIFLDEIGDTSPVIQSKLLNVLEEKKIRRLGGIEDIPVHARIIAATSKDLSSMMKSGTMRKDLFYRLAVFALELPPLRERAGDIPILAEHFFRHFEKENGKHIRGFTPEAMEKLSKGRWDGNVRELKHAIERAVLLSTTSRIAADDIEMTLPPEDVPLRREGDASLPHSSESSDGAIVISFSPEDASLSRVEKELVKEILRHVKGNKKKASSLLKISRPRLDRIIKSDPEFFAPGRS
ncbi:MAG TPA: sigma-54 dependent transcriptional regulator [Bacteroidota bacterium]|nr:sigma-54 dependent transcriptional regulator [Bacteroidota bacterium]